MDKKIAQQIINHLDQARRVLMITHPQPDGDGLGAVCAFKKYLEQKSIESILFCKTPAQKDLQFLPFVEELTTDISVFEDKKIDTVISFDAGDVHYLGLADEIEKIKNTATIINIDHHPSNTEYGHLNIVKPSAASTTDIVHEFFDFADHEIDEDIATCILSGLVSDTNHFSNAATTASAMALASKMIAKGAKLHTIRKNILQNKSVSLLKLWGIALARLYYQPTQDAVITYLFQKDYEHFGLTENEVQGIPNFLNNLDEGKYSLFLLETQDDKIRGSLRTTCDDIDVSEIARKFDGGGHQKAAGFTTPGRLEETGRGVKIVSNF